MDKDPEPNPPTKGTAEGKESKDGGHPDDRSGSD